MNDAGYFPFFINIEGASCLVAGGGTVALRKIEKLLPFGVQIHVVAPAVSPEIQAICRDNKAQVHCLERAFEENDLEGMLFVIAATDDTALNASIAGLCRERNILVNAVDDKKNCSFLFPALCKEGNLCVGITTGGTSPSASKYIRKQIEQILPARIDEHLETLQKERQEIKAQIPDQRLRAQAYEERFLSLMTQEE